MGKCTKSEVSVREQQKVLEKLGESVEVTGTWNSATLRALQQGASRVGGYPDRPECGADWSNPRVSSSGKRVAIPRDLWRKLKEEASKARVATTKSSAKVSPLKTSVKTDLRTKGAATTAASETASWVSRSPSTSAGYTFSPPTIIISSSRPTM